MSTLALVYTYPGPLDNVSMSHGSCHTWQATLASPFNVDQESAFIKISQTKHISDFNQLHMQVSEY